MDKSILRKFAIESRQELMSKIKNKIQTFYIDEDFSKEQKGELYVLSNEKHSLSLTKEEYQKRELLIKRIKELSLEQVIEEAAYTWFNRIIAIRYMEINDMLPLTKDNQSLGIRVLSSKDNTPDPEILKFSNLMNSELDIELKKDKYIELKNDNEKFKYVLLLVCKKLGNVIPQVFDGVTDYIDILIPDNLLNDTGFITKVIRDVPENNFNQVEIIGWLYQYYNQTEKDRVMSNKKAYKKNEIPYATQLFTPDWIVKYMVENSLGKYWAEHNSKENMLTLKNKWKYLVEDNIKYQDSKVNPQEITFIDPCCGSGHILVYAFEIFYQIYQSMGYNKTDIPELILRNNLYGLDIDDRAGQLSILSILLKARENDKNIFNKDIVRNLNIMSIQESNNINEFVITNITDEQSKDNIIHLIDNFENAKEIGSLLKLEKRDYSKLEESINNDETIFGIELKEKIIPLIKQANILSNKYKIVVTNPPYMNKGSMDEPLKKYVFKNYPDSKTDLYAAFIETSLVEPNGFLAMITQHTWMFINSFKDLRNKIITDKKIESLVHLGTRAFEEIGGEIVQTSSFVLKNETTNDNSIFIRLVDVNNASEKEIEFLKIINNKNNNYFIIDSKELLKINNIPLAYWLSKKMLDTFNYELISDYTIPKAGVVTGNDNYFVRFWYEPKLEEISLILKEKKSYGKYHLFQKGGGFRRYYGNQEYVIKLQDLFNDSCCNNSVRRGDSDYYFRKGIGWSQIGTSSTKSFRIIENSVCGTATPTIYLKNDKYYYYMLGLLNTKYSDILVNIFNPTMNLLTTDVGNIPFIIDDNYVEKISEVVKNNIELCKEDWDSFETSIDFIRHPLIPSFDGVYDIVNNKFENKHCWISGLYESWEEHKENTFNELKRNEEEINKTFLDIYGLKDEICIEIKDEDITIRKANKIREIKSLISYAVGCMFGRYSLDENGIVCAGSYFDINRYKKFKADIDNIIPITDEAYFADDIVGKFKKFVEIVYGVDTLNDNLDFIAETLGKKGTETSEDTIRRYFNNDFYSDHIKMYQKKPIYWLFDSGKKNGFKCLIYMHRYNEGLVPKVRLDYLHKIQTTYEKLLADVNYKLTTDLSMSDKKEAQRRQAELSAKLQETKEYDEKIAHIANQKINIDLDDGVSINYDKFKDILTKLK